MGIIRAGLKAFGYLLVFSIGYYLGGGCDRDNVKEKIIDTFSYRPPVDSETIDERLLSNSFLDVNGIEHLVLFPYHFNEHGNGNPNEVRL